MSLALSSVPHNDGESFLAVPLANNKRESGWTVNQAVAGLGELRAKLVTRVE